MKTPGWYAVRIELAAAIVAPLLAGLLILAPPNTMGGTSPMDSWAAAASWVPAPAIGVVMYIVGLAWMIRIYRADPEAHPSWWRAVRSR